MDTIVALADGRRVGLSMHGDPEGWPLFLFHGSPSSRLGNEYTDEPARARGIRVLCPDRPGIGRSDPKARLDVGETAADVAELADALGIGRFGVLGYSGGGPYALAAAARLPERVRVVGLMAAAGPLDRPGARTGLTRSDLLLLGLSSRRPRAAHVVLRVVASYTRLFPAIALRIAKAELSDADRRAMDERGSMVMATFNEAFRQGPGGVIQDYRLLDRAWGFDFEDVRAPVHLWHGDVDKVVPFARSEEMAAWLPNAFLHLVHGAGHLTIQLEVGAILDSLAES
jgi:pimeloyl-ACP methyl ester carboxylesterase